jgi:drug/metabolite transporter (DMT)-like permease
MSKNKSYTDLHFVLIMLIAVIVWAFAFPFIRIGLDELSFINLTIMRFFIVCCILLILLVILPKKISRLQKKDIIPIFILGFFGVIVYHLGLNYGELYVSPGAASLIIATIPIQILILAVIFLKEKITSIKLLGIILALLGVIIISIWGTKDEVFEIKYITAAIAIFIAAGAGAFYTIAGKKLLARYSGLSLTVYAMLLGSIGLLPLTINSSLISQVTNLSIKGWFALMFLGIFSTVIGYVIWYIALEKKAASEISVYLYLIPVLSTIISYFLLNEEITLMFILGGMLVISGLAIVNMKTKIVEKQKTD